MGWGFTGYPKFQGCAGGWTGLVRPPGGGLMEGGPRGSPGLEPEEPKATEAGSESVWDGESTREGRCARKFGGEQMLLEGQ